MFIMNKWEDLPPPLTARAADLLISPLVRDRKPEPGKPSPRGPSQTSLDIVRQIQPVLVYLQHRLRGTQVRSALFSDHDCIAAILFAVKRLEGTISAWTREGEFELDVIEEVARGLHSPEPLDPAGVVKLPRIPSSSSLAQEQLEEEMEKIELERLKRSLPEWMR